MASSPCDIALNAALGGKIRLLKRHCEAVRLLLSKGVHVDPMDHRGTPLHLAVAKDHVEVVKVLLEHGADPNRVANHVFSPLMMAVCGKALKCMKLLIEHGKVPIELAAAHGQRELVEILFPKTKAIPAQPVWSVNGIMNTVRSPCIKPQGASSVEQRIADLKSRGKEAFGKGDYLTAMYFYGLVMEIDPVDASMFANRSLCWLRMREGDRALKDARQCIMMRPRWSKAWYREGKALSFMKDYKGASVAFLKAQELDPKSDEITEALREAVNAMEELRV